MRIIKIAQASSDEFKWLIKRIYALEYQAFQIESFKGFIHPKRKENLLASIRQDGARIFSTLKGGLLSSFDEWSRVNNEVDFNDPDLGLLADMKEKLAAKLNIGPETITQSLIDKLLRMPEGKREKMEGEIGFPVLDLLGEVLIANMSRAYRILKETDEDSNIHEMCMAISLYLDVEHFGGTLLDYHDIFTSDPDGFHDYGFIEEVGKKGFLKNIAKPDWDIYEPQAYEETHKARPNSHNKGKLEGLDDYDLDLDELMVG